MNSQPEEDLQRRLQQIEAEINSFSSQPSTSETEKPRNESGFGKFKGHLQRFQIWFQNLSGMKKLAVSSVGIILSLLVLQTVFKLVSFVISLAVLAALVYLGYKFFVANNWQGKQ